MNILLDTCTLLWSALEVKKLSRRAARLIEDPDNIVFLSAVSVWEIEVKYRLGKIKLEGLTPGDLVIQGQEELDLYELSFDIKSALIHESLPAIHKDPFDRMLICQANVHDLTIVSPDEGIKAYDVKTEW